MVDVAKDMEKSNKNIANAFVIIVDDLHKLLSQTLILGKAKKDFFLDFGGYIIFLANILKSLYTINLT